MSTDPRHVPRFIPTLTEVVDPATLDYGSRRPAPDVQALVEAVRCQLRPAFERRLQQEYERLVKSLVTEPWDDISRRLHGEMEQLIAQAVTDCLHQRPIATQEDANS